MREVPVPGELVGELVSIMPEDLNLFWSHQGKAVSRVTAYRWIKGIMHEAGIDGRKASPKGLRHGFGVHATLSGVQLHMLCRWMGHASVETTSIYATVCGREERVLAERMW